MNAREFIVLADQLAAFNAIMKGDLAKETAAAKDALAAKLAAVANITR